MSTTRAHQILEEIIQNNIISSSQISLNTTWQQARQHYADLIFLAEKFYLGNTRDLPEISHPCIDLIKLPAPIMYVDMEIYVESDTSKEIEQLGVIFLNRPPDKVIETNTFFKDFYDNLLLVSYTFLKPKISPHWIFAPWTSAVIHKDNEICIVSEADSKEAVNLVEKSIKFITEYHGAFLSFLHLINCPNVTIEKIVEPTKLNKKRAANNRPPIQEYSIVKLPNYSASQDHKGGTHASPRGHFRRGHIRRLSETKVTWVRHTMVQGAGFIPKHYVRG